MAIFRALNHFVVGGNEAFIPFEQIHFMLYVIQSNIVLSRLSL
jgi:hypothetical protein